MLRNLHFLAPLCLPLHDQLTQAWRPWWVAEEVGENEDRELPGAKMNLHAHIQALLM